jgi:DNA transposition AAA+ family ATPase
MTVVDITKGEKVSPMLARIDDPKLRERTLAAQQYLQEKYKALGTWSAVAKHIRGYSESALVAFASGSYTANPGKVVAAIERARLLAEERHAHVFVPEFADTSIAKRIMRLVRQTRTRGQLSICAGHSGTGKSTTFAEIVREDSTVTYVRCNPMFGVRAWPVLQLLGGKLGVSLQKNDSPVACFEKISELLLSSRRILIFDESQHLNRPTLDTLRTLSEDAETPIVFAGNDQVHEFRFLSGASAAAFVQFSSRCVVQEFLKREEITKGDVDLIASQKLDDETLAEVRDDLLAEARSDGGFRRLHAVLQRAFEKARAGRITDAHVYAAIQESSSKRGAL